jgi:serine-type D-Ala-D-Ala carboxypeptidase (penicillin-binding protein 5/6)
VPRLRPGIYRVRPGDTVASIATEQGILREELRRSNSLEPTAPLLVGQLLQVPAPPTIASAGPQKVRELSPGWVSAERAVVIDEASGEILWARDANTPVAPASLTKIVTALVVLDHAELTDQVTVQVDSRRMPGSTVMGIYPGEELTIEDLLYGMMLPSGNDAAMALAQYVAGTREAFAALMNQKARTLGLTASNFVNPDGWDSRGHLSSAYDMAMLAREGMRNPVFQSLARSRSYATGHGKGYEVGNLNQLLWRFPGADGVKIGYTDAAGRAIVGSASRNGHRVFVSMMRSNDIYADSEALLNWAFASYEWD